MPRRKRPGKSQQKARDLFPSSAAYTVVLEQKKPARGKATALSKRLPESVLASVLMDGKTQRGHRRRVEEKEREKQPLGPQRTAPQRRPRKVPEASLETSCSVTGNWGVFGPKGPQRQEQGFRSSSHSVKTPRDASARPRKGPK